MPPPGNSHPQICASPEAVWRLLADSPTWPTWPPIDSYEHVRDAGPDEAGEVRIFRNGRHTLREEIVERRERQRLSYVLLAGLALRDYRASIDLAAREDGSTDPRWHTPSSHPSCPAPGGPTGARCTQRPGLSVDGLASAAAGTGSTTGS